MMPFCKNVSLRTRSTNLCRVANRVVQILDLLHKPDHGLTPAEVDVLLLGNAETVLGRDTSISRASPLIHKRLEQLLDLGIPSSGGDIQMQVGVTHVTEPDNIDYWVFVVIAHQVRILNLLPGFFDQFVQIRYRNGKIVLVYTSPVHQGLGDAFSASPEILELLSVLCNDTIVDNLLAHGVF